MNENRFTQDPLRNGHASSISIGNGGDAAATPQAAPPPQTPRPQARPGQNPAGAAAAHEAKPHEAPKPPPEAAGRAIPSRARSTRYGGRRLAK